MIGCVDVLILNSNTVYKMSALKQTSQQIEQKIELLSYLNNLQKCLGPSSLCKSEKVPNYIVYDCINSSYLVTKNLFCARFLSETTLYTHTVGL